MIEVSTVCTPAVNPTTFNHLNGNVFKRAVEKLLRAFLRLSFLGEALNGFQKFVWSNEKIQKEISLWSDALDKIEDILSSHSKDVDLDCQTLLKHLDYVAACERYRKLASSIFIFDVECLESLQELTGEETWGSIKDGGFFIYGSGGIGPFSLVDFSLSLESSLVGLCVRTPTLVMSTSQLCALSPYAPKPQSTPVPYKGKNPNSHNHPRNYRNKLKIK